MKTKRILALLLALTMIMSFVPNFGTMVYAANEPTIIQSDTKENTNQAGGIVYTKTSSAKSDGTVDITLTAHTTGVVRQLSSVTPTDIVLVLDASGSMNNDYSTTTTSYNEVTGSEYTYTTGIFLWQEEHTAYGFRSTSTARYINTGTQSEPVYTRVTYTGRDANGFEMYEYTAGEQEIVIYPKLSGNYSAQREHSGYSVVQFYSVTTSTNSINKMESLRSAVNTFIDTTATMNEGLDAGDMHNISIVKFAGPHYSNDTTDTPTIIEGNGTYTLSNGSNRDTSNYTQVVKGLTAVDEDGVTALKTAVSEITPAGATAVDKGLALAEAVLMNRSEVVTEGAVDRNEVVIVFTDGEPNHWSGFNQNVANDAISVSKRMKDTADVTIYSVCIDANADETDLTANINKFMHYISSNYPSAENMSSATSGCDTSLGYYKTTDNTKSLEMIFESIIQDIDHPTVTLGEEATMVDTLSPYFDFQGDVSAVILQTSERIPDGNGGFTWAEPVADSSLRAVITEDRLTVDGFDFDTNYISETGRGDNNNFYGKQLVVSFTVVPDYDVIDMASATLMDGILPTNSGFASLVDSESASQADVITPELSAHQVIYTVDGQEYATYNRFTGSDIEIEAVPSKEGYTFSGWSVDGNPAEVGSTLTMPDEDVEIVGTFTANTYNVNYQYSGTQPDGAPALPAAHTAQFGDTVEVADTLSLQGYTFVGWYPLQTDVTLADNGTFQMPAKDVTLVGHFESATATPYYVEHYLETLTDGVYEDEPEVSESFNGTTGHTVTATPLSRFEGFTYNEQKSAQTISGEIKPDGSLVLKLYYDRNEYDVEYGYEGDTQIDGLPSLPTGGKYKYGETVVVAPAAVPPAGYSFTGWYRGTIDNMVTEFTMPAYSVHLLGYFAPNDGTAYMVEHYLMGTDGQYPQSPETTETFYGTTGHSVDALPLTTFEGFTYNAGVSTASGTILGDGSLVLKLYYDRAQFNVEYVYERDIPQGASALPAAQSYYHGANVSIAPDATAPLGYTFSGWHVHGEEVTITEGSFEMPKRNVTVYGYFTANTDTQYKVEHYIEGFTDGVYEATPYLEKTFTGTTGTEVSASAIAIEGFTYNDTASAGTKTGVIAGDGSLVLKLYYDRNEYDVEYGYEGDTQIDGLPSLPTGGTYKYGETVTVATKASLAGYTFTGWYRGTTDTPADGTFVMPAYSVHLLGFFTADVGTEYTVEHYLMDTDGNYEVEPEVTETFYGTTDNPVTAQPLTTFEGFTYNAGVSTPSGTILGDGSLVLKLYYDRTQYEVEYAYEGDVPQGASVPPRTHTYYHGTEVDVEADATAPLGYTFGGWHVHGEEVTITNGSFEMPKRNVTLYGRFVANTDTEYTVEHYIQNVDGTDYEDDPHTVQTFTGTTGTEVTAVPIAIAGFAFNEAESSGTRMGEVAGDGSLVLKLYYDRNSYRVIYEYDGNVPSGASSLPLVAEYVYGETVQVEDEAIAPAGYTFVGWYRGEVSNIVTDFEMPDRDVVLKGYFEPDNGTEYTVEHYLMDENGEYEATPEVTQTFLGTTDDDVEALPLTTFVGFTYNANESTATGTIAGDGSLVLKLYYDRLQYEVEYVYERDIPQGASGLPNTEIYYHGEEVVIEDDAEAPGYTFSGWHVHGEEVTITNGTFEMPKRKVTVYGYFTANTDTEYTVEHYVQKLDGNGYEATPHITQTFTGTTGAEVTAVAIAIEGFTFNEAESVTTRMGKVAGDGSLVLKLYYDRNRYNVSYEYEGQIPAGEPALPLEAEYVYGATVQVADKAIAPSGYTFVGWYRGEVTNIVTEFEMPARDVVLKGYFRPGENTQYKVRHYLETLTEGVYEIAPGATEIFTGTTGHTVNATPLNRFIGYTYNDGISNASGVILGDGSLVLQLYYDRDQYAVEYVYERDIPQGASTLPNLQYFAHGESVTIEPDAEAPGYTFSGWHVHSEDVTVTNGTFEMPKRKVTIYGYFTANTNTQYKVEHYVQKLDGTGYEDAPYTTQTFTGVTGTAVEATPIAIAGFAYNGAASERTKAGEILGDGSLVLKLYYDRNVHKVTYVYEGDVPAGTPALPHEAEYVYGASVQVADRAIAPAGYTFVGWYRGEVTNIVTSFEMPDRDVVLKGYFRPGESTAYTVHHYLETVTDGVYKATPEVEESFSGTTGHSVSATPLNRFVGYTYNETKSAPTITGTILGDGSLVLKVYYDRKSYKVTYGYEGDVPAGTPALPLEAEYVYGAPVQVADKVTPPSGHTFIGWYRGTVDNPVSGTFNMPSFDVHILGSFTANTNTPYRVEHYLQNVDGSGYTLDGTGETRYGITGDRVTALPKEYTGFTYNEGISTTDGTISGDGTTCLKFYYDRNAYKVTYQYEGMTPAGAPTAPAEATYVYGTPVQVADGVNIPGYTFVGWYEGTSNNIVTAFDMPSHDVVLKAGFNSNEVDYEVKYWFQKIDAGTTFDATDYELDPASYTRKALVGQHVEADSISREGFYVNNANSVSYGHATVDGNGNGNLVLNIYLDRHTYNVTYAYYGDQPAGAPDLTGKNKENVRYGAILTVDTKPQLDGHTFDGWYTHTATVHNDQFTMPNHDVEFLGRFAAQFTVSYDLNGGNGVAGVDYNAQAVNAGTDVTVKDAPSRSGYTFKGWKNVDTTFNPGDTVTVDRNIIFVAQWSRNGGGGSTGGVTNYTLTYETNGGNEIKNETYRLGTTVELKKVPLKDGYVFEGWHLDAALTEDVTEVKMNKDITVYASWVKDNGGAGLGHSTPGSLNNEDHFAYVVGYPDGTVKPEANILRSETAAIFFRLLKAEVRDGNFSKENAFDDVAADDWFNSSVSTLVRLGIVVGKTEDTFDPDAYITRAEFAAICARFDDSDFEVIDTFTDVSGHWAEDEIHEAAAHGWIKGYEDNTFRPDQFITRAEAMSMINRVLNRIPETKDDLLDSMIHWPDNQDEAKWYYLAVQEATNSHDFDMKNHVYEKWTAIRDVIDWAKYNK